MMEQAVELRDLIQRCEMLRAEGSYASVGRCLCTAAGLAFQLSDPDAVFRAEGPGLSILTGPRRSR